MAVFGTRTIKYTGLFTPAIKSSGGITSNLNSPRLGKPTAGAITVRITTAVTLQSPSDGTMLGNNAARTNVNLTAFSGVHTVSLFPYELDQWDSDADAVEFKVFVDAARRKAEFEIVTDLVGGTASTIKTWPIGQISAAADGTAQETFTTLQRLDQTYAGLMSNVQDMSQVFGITTPTTYANLQTCIGQSQYGQYLSQDASGKLTYKGRPIYMYNGAAVTGFGDAASDDNFYWVHPDAEALTWIEAFSPNGGQLQHEADGFFKKYFHTWGFAGLIQGTHYATVTNPTS